MLNKLKEKISDVDYYKKHPHLKLLHPLMDRPYLWDLKNIRAVALGFAIGAFFSFVVPFMQFLIAGLFAILLRANLPVALVSTLISNPLTFIPIYAAALSVGNYLLPYFGYEKIDNSIFNDFDWGSLGDIWLYVWSGLFVLALIVSILGYVFIMYGSRIRKTIFH